MYADRLVSSQAKNPRLASSEGSQPPLDLQAGVGALERGMNVCVSFVKFVDTMRVPTPVPGQLPPGSIQIPASAALS
jgi:hypothetical protein